MRARLLLLALLSASLAAALPASAQEECVRKDGVGGICVTADPTCPVVTYKPPFEDSAGLATVCLTITPTETGQVTCVLVQGGFYGRGGGPNHEGMPCVHVDHAGGETCVALSYQGDLGTVPPKPKCLLA